MGISNSGGSVGIEAGGVLEKGGVRFRHYPYPFRSMLAICSDLDETPTLEAYLETSRFLNTGGATSIGDGVDLEVGNTIYFYMPPDQFAYWNTDEAGRDRVRELIRSGHVDCFHSYGDEAKTRKHAAMVLDDLERHGCRMEVWIDHGTAITNLGADIMAGSGDVPGTAAYHADLTCDFGVEFTWTGRVTSVIGQDTGRSLAGVWDARHPIVSAKTVAKEYIKGVLGATGNRKYRAHHDNKVLRATSLRNGRKVWEFLRANPHWGGVSSAETADGIGEVLTPSFLDRLIKREGTCVLYTHLGKYRRTVDVFDTGPRAALRTLATYARSGRVLVTTTRRLLGYIRALQVMEVSASFARDNIVVEASGSFRESDMDGITMEVPAGKELVLLFNGKPMSTVRRAEAGANGLVWYGVPWKRLAYPVW